MLINIASGLLEALLRRLLGAPFCLFWFQFFLAKNLLFLEGQKWFLDLGPSLVCKSILSLSYFFTYLMNFLFCNDFVVGQRLTNMLSKIIVKTKLQGMNRNVNFVSWILKCIFRSCSWLLVVQPWRFHSSIFDCRIDDYDFINWNNPSDAKSSARRKKKGEPCSWEKVDFY